MMMSGALRREIRIYLRLALLGAALCYAPSYARANGNVHVTRFWHNHQPLYWPEWNSNGSQTQRGQYAWDSIVLKGGQNYGGLSPNLHPQNDLEEIFSKDDRKQAYQDGPRQSLTTFTGGGFAISYSGSLIDNVRQLGGGGHLGYGSGWASGNRTARGWGRLDLVGFTYHHSLAPLLPKEVFRKELQIFKQAWWKAWNGSGDLSDHSKGFFPTEMAYSRHMIDVLVDEGYEWVIVASHHISRTSPSYNTKADPTGSYNIFSSPPNKSDQLGPTFNDGWWYSQPNPGNAAWNVSPFAYQLHKVKYVNPETGAEKLMVAVPSDDVLSYRYGYANEGISKIQSFISPFATDPNRPVIVMPSTDGDNAWGGGSSSWMEATPQYFNESGAAGYNKTMPGNFVNAFKQYAPVTHIEDGAWIFPESDYGSPHFLKWIEPPIKLGSPTAVPGTMVDMETPGFALKFFSYAPLMAGANWVITAEQILKAEGGQVRPWVIHAPYDWSGTGYGDRNDVELAWHIYLKGLDSGFNYYGGLGNDDEVKPALATKRAIDKLQSFMSTRMNQDQTPPTVLKPQRFPYNPGWYTFGWFNSIPGGDTRYLKKMPSEFYLWTHAYDVSGIATVNAKVRVDLDGVNTMANNQNETYAGGADVGAWVSIPMTKRVLPKTRAALNAAASNGQIDYFVFDPAFWANPVIADYYFVKINDSNLPGFRGKLVDYYIEATDARGNVHKSEIQQVWVEDDGQGVVTSSVTFSSDPRDCAGLVVTYNATNGPLQGVSPVYQQISFDNGVTYSNRLMVNQGPNVWVHTNAVPDNAPSARVWFQNAGNTLSDNNGGNNWSVNIRDCDAPTGPATAVTLPANPNSCDPVIVRYYPNAGLLKDATTVKIHIGRNNWAGGAISPNPTMTKVGNYWEYTYNTPTNTTQIDFVFNNGASLWDNNNGADWHVAVTGCGSNQPAPTVSINPAAPVGCDPITITYNPSGRPLVGVPLVFIHIGYNGWQDVILPNPAMTATGSVWTYVYTPPPGTTNINMAFNNGGAVWDSNGGADWNFVVTDCPEGPVGPTGLAITNPPADVIVVNSTSTYNVKGIAENITGDLSWSNHLTGASGTLPATTPWTVAGVALAVGTNGITVRGTVAGSGGRVTNAADNVSNYGGVWTNGSNQGSGFGPWTLYSDGTSGRFTAPSGWGLWAQSASLSEAVRPLSAPMAVGQRLEAIFQNNWVLEGQQGVGMAIRDTNGASLVQFFFNGGDDFYTVSDAGGGRSSGIGWTNRAQQVSIERVTASTYRMLVDGVEITGSFTSTPSQVRFWNYNGGSGSNYDFLFNNVVLTSPGSGGGATTSDTVRITRVPSGDSNGDGVPDAWYAQYLPPGTDFSDPNVGNAMGLNGHSLHDSYFLGLNPNDPQSTFRFEGMSLSGGAVQVNWAGMNGRRYVVQHAPLAAGIYQDVSGSETNVPGDGTTRVQTPSLMGPPTNSTGFYRVRYLERLD